MFSSFQTSSIGIGRVKIPSLFSFTATITRLISKSYAVMPLGIGVFISRIAR